MTRAMQYIISATLAGMLALAGTLAQAAPGSGREDVGRLRSQFEDARRNLASREADLDRLEREREHDRDEWRHLRQRQAALEAELCREQEVLFALANDLAWRRQVAPGDQWNFDRAVANVAQRRQDLAAADAEASATATALADLRLRAADLVRQSDVDAAAAEAKKRVGFVNAQVDRALDALEKRADYQVVMAAERDLANQIFAALWAEPFDVNAAVQTFGLWIAASDRVTTMRRAAVDNDPQVIALRKDADAAVDVHQALVQRVNDQAPLAQALTDSETRAADADGRRAAAGQSLQDAETDLWRIQDQLAARNAELGPVQLAIFDHRCRAEAIARELDRVRDAAYHADSDDRRGHGPWQAAQVRRDEARASVDDLSRRLHDAEGRETADQRRQREQREQQERRHQEELARAEAQRKAEAERQHKIQEEKEARERVARLDAARPKTADDLRLGMLQEEQKKEAAKKAADAQKAEEARKVEQQRQDQLRKSEEARKADEARKIDAARKAELAKADQARKADEAHEAELAKADRARKAEQARKAEDARKADLAKTDQSRKAEEARKSEEARKAALAQQQKAEEQRKLSEQRDQQAKAEAARKANEARKAEETRKADEARTSAAADAQRKVEDEKRQRDEQARLEAARIRTAEDQRVWIMRQQQQEKQEKEKQENERRQREEAARKADEDRKAAEMRKADEVRRVEEAKDADAARRADAARKADEAKKAEEEKKADEARKAEERRRQQEEAGRKAEPAGGPPRRGK